MLYNYGNWPESWSQTEWITEHPFRKRLIYSTDTVLFPLGLRELPSDYEEDYGGRSRDSSDVNSASGSSSSSDSGDESGRGTDDDGAENKSSDTTVNMTEIIKSLVEKGMD